MWHKFKGNRTYIIIFKKGDITFRTALRPIMTSHYYYSRGHSISDISESKINFAIAVTFMSERPIQD